SRDNLSRMTHGTMVLIIVFSVISPFIQVDTAQAASQGPRYPTGSSDCVNDNSNGSFYAWTAPDRAISDNNLYANKALSSSNTQYLKCTNFGFTIPTDSTIMGITVSAGRFASATNIIRDQEVKLVKGGTIQTHDKADTFSSWPTTETVKNYGSTSDLWGSTWTVADINASNFGVAFSVNAMGSATANVDYIRVTVEYAIPTFEQSAYRWFNNQDADKSTFAVGWGTPGDDIARDVAVDSAGNSYVVGYAASRYGQASNSMDQTLVKYNKNGVEQWSKTWGGTGTDDAWDVELDSSGNIYVAGYTDSSDRTAGGNDQTLVKYNSDGIEQWSKTWGSASYHDYARGLALDASGNIYVVGSAGSATNGYDQTLVKYNSSGLEQWSKTWGGTGADRALGVVLDTSLNIYVVGETASTDRSKGLLDQTLVKYNSSGVEQWSKTWGDTGDDSAYGVVLDSSTNIYVVGFTDSSIFSAGLKDQTLVKYNSLGVEQWSKTWGDTADDVAFDVDLDASGNIYVAGFTESYTSGLEDQSLIKYNSSGVEQWTKTWGSSSGDEDAHAVWVDDDTNIIVAGYAMSTDLTGGGQDQALLKFDSTGAIADCTSYCVDRTTAETNRITAETNRVVGETNVITAEVNRAVSETDFSWLMKTLVHCGDVASFVSSWGGSYGYSPADVAVDADENAYVVGADGYSQVLVKFDSVGIEQWSKSWGGDGYSVAYGVALDSSGNIFVAGSSNSTGLSSETTFGDQTLVKYNSSGVEQWSKSWGGDGLDEAYDVALDSSGNIYVVGYSKSSGLSSETTYGDQTLVKYNSSGVEQWSKSWGGAGIDIAHKLALDSSGNIFVVGSSNSTGLSSETAYGDQTLVKYNSSGVEQWSKSWGGDRSDIAYGIALDSSGNIYTTGISASTGLSSETTYGDQTLVKYNNLGVEQWSKSMGDVGYDVGYAVTVSSAGDIYVSGDSASQSIVKYNSNGDVQWHKYLQKTISYFGFGAYLSQGIAISSSGNIFAAGLVEETAASPTVTPRLTVTKTLPTTTDISGSIRADYSTAVDRTATEVDRTIVEVNRDTVEVNRVTGETNIDTAEIFENEVIAEPTIDVGAPLNNVAQNTATLAPAAGPFRLRLGLHVGTADASPGTSFKLQYAQKSGTCDTAFTGETYADVTSGTPVGFYDNTNGFDGLLMKANANDPTHSGHSNVMQEYQEANNASVINAIPFGSDGLWDFALTADSAPVNTSYCFRLVTSAGASLNTYSVVAEITTPPLDFRQTSHRWFDSTLAALSAQNTTATLARHDTPVRLRILLDPVKAASVSDADVKLQYAPRVGTCDISFTGETYVDVGTGTGFNYYDNPLYSDGSTISSSGLDPTDGNTVVYQAYEEAAPFTNLNAMTATGQSGLWDISLTASQDAPGGAYCFRVVQQSSGAVLSAYDYVPELVLPPAMSQVMRHGSWFDAASSKQPFYW
ncbi:hypothetical protein EOM60_05390, partial [Candidatus Saccharibacteria bacterium]|nr:hypothetical protein [Candidatus Saccharibacteria bacterium]